MPHGCFALLITFARVFFLVSVSDCKKTVRNGSVPKREAKSEAGNRGGVKRLLASDIGIALCQSMSVSRTRQ